MVYTGMREEKEIAKQKVRNKKDLNRYKIF